MTGERGEGRGWGVAGSVVRLWHRRQGQGMPSWEEGLHWGDENLQVAVCRTVALGATVAMRRGVWGARVSKNLLALGCPPSASGNMLDGMVGW